MSLPTVIVPARKEWEIEVVQMFDGLFRVGTPIPNQMYRSYGIYRDKELAIRRLRQIQRSRGQVVALR